MSCFQPLRLWQNFIIKSTLPQRFINMAEVRKRKLGVHGEHKNFLHSTIRRIYDKQLIIDHIFWLSIPARLCQVIICNIYDTWSSVDQIYCPAVSALLGQVTIYRIYKRYNFLPGHYKIDVTTVKQFAIFFQKKENQNEFLMQFLPPQ